MDDRQRAIPTRFAGFRFRSMLEARWAVFFDALNIKYLYEPQGFVTDGKPYLPDFCLLLGHMLWAEVKPAFETDPDGVSRWSSFVLGRGDPGILLTDMTSRPGPFLYLGPLGPQHDAQWCACPDGYHFEPVSYCDVRRCDSCGSVFQDEGYNHPKIAAAYELARSYQFDRR